MPGRVLRLFRPLGRDLLDYRRGVPSLGLLVPLAGPCGVMLTVIDAPWALAMCGPWPWLRSMCGASFPLCPPVGVALSSDDLIHTWLSAHRIAQKQMYIVSITLCAWTFVRLTD